MEITLGPKENKPKSKRNGYILYSLVMLFLFWWFSSEIGFNSGSSSATVSRIAILIFFVTLLGSYLTQWSALSLSKGRYRGVVVSILPMSLSFGIYLSLYHFPNFSPLFKAVALIFASSLYYLISLVNNILLVVDERESVFPLYRVAITWGQILLSFISIPVYVGIYKFDQGPLYQNFLAGVLTFVFMAYYLWIMGFDKRARRFSTLELITDCSFGAFLVMIGGFSVSFIPTEAFLRGILASSVLLFGLNYLDGYAKNKLNKNFLYVYGAIIGIFLVLVLIFRP